MNRVEQYTQIVQQTIHEFYNLYQQMQDAQTFCIVDPASRHYQVIQTGWDSRHRRIYTSLHLSIQDEKVYIHSDPTEEGIANILIEKGIPQWDIVLEYQLGWRSPATTVKSWVFQNKSPTVLQD